MTTTQDFTLPGQSTPNPTPALEEQSNLVKPAVEMEALTAFLADVCGDLFIQMVRDARDSERVLALTDFFAWATKYRISHRDHSGLVDRALDDAAPGMMLSAINVIYGY